MIKIDDMLRDDDMEDREVKKRVLEVTDREINELFQRLLDVIAEFKFDGSDEINAGMFSIVCDDVHGDELQIERRTFVLHSALVEVYNRFTILSGNTKANTLRIIDGLMASEEYIRESYDNLVKLQAAQPPKSKDSLN